MIEVNNLNKTYDRRRVGENHVLHDVSFTLPDTGFVCILGPSGCGKTSLLNAIGGLDSFDSGTISMGETTVSRYGTALFEAERNRSFGYIFQNFYLLPEHSVGYNVYLGLHSLKLTHAQKIRRVKEALKAVEMERYIRRNVGELSGGQQQRVAIARALARKPRVIFADEPTGNLDETNTINICSLLRKISRTSLVVMVTHEERIAEFFADRIISLDAGRIRHDSDSWQRGGLSAGSTKAIYTGDYPESKVDANRVSLRIFQQEGIDPVNISVVALKDRIVIKIDDSRAVSCGSSQDAPTVVEGKRPVVTLQEVDRSAPGQEFLFQPENNVPTAAGKGITARDMLREAAHMGHGKKLRGFGTKIFLLILTVLLALSTADFVTLATLDPEDFITTHSQVLEVNLDRGPRAGSSTVGMQLLAREFKAYMARTDIAYTYAPNIAYDATVSGSPILQADAIGVTLRDFTYTPLQYLDSATLILGRMPENSQEIVIDRWVLDAVMAEDGIAQNGITGMDYFLDKPLQYTALKAAPVIVGICDSGQPSVYLSDEMLASIGASGTEVISLSSFQSMYPGEYDSVVLAEDECIVLPVNAGEGFLNSLNGTFSTVCGSEFTIVDICGKEDCYAKIVVADSMIDDLMINMSQTRFWIFTEDKEGMADHLLNIADRMGDTIKVTVTDTYAVKMAEYAEAAGSRMDARTIVIATVMLLSMVMLYLLRRADVYGHIGMLSVYRLLGIPSSKAVGIFAIESLIGSLSTALPAAFATWAVIAVMRLYEATDLVFPWTAAAGVYIGILFFHLLVTVLPLRGLLKLPPARLAAKYDF